MALDYTFERQILLERNKSWREGFVEGFIESYKETAREIYIEKGREIEILQSVKDGDYDSKRGAEKLGISIVEFDELLGKMEDNL